MPADFDKCVADGGRVRTITLKSGRYMHVCYDKNGKSHAGEVKKSKESNSRDNLNGLSPKELLEMAYSKKNNKEAK